VRGAAREKMQIPRKQRRRRKPGDAQSGI